MSDCISRKALLDRYDAEHVGPPGRARELIVTAPAADVAPVRRGEWIGVDTSYWRWYHDTARTVFSKSFRCSECGRKTIIREKFCPSCGAKMEKEKA